MCDDLQLRARDVLSQEPGGWEIRPILFPAEDQGGAADAARPGAEVQVFHGAPQGKGIPLVKGHGREDGLGQEPEHRILEGKGRPGNLVRRADQHQRPHLLRVLQRVVQGQDPAQGEAAKVEGLSHLRAIIHKGGAEIGVAGLLPPEDVGELRAKDVLTAAQTGNRLLPACRPVPGAVNQNDLRHKRPPRSGVLAYSTTSPAGIPVPSEGPNRTAARTPSAVFWMAQDAPWRSRIMRTR